MSISEHLLPEFDQEISGTRKTLERVPTDKFNWKPHPKSGSMLWLAGHLANLPTWGTLTVSHDELDMAPGGKPMDPPPRPPIPPTCSQPRQRTPRGAPAIAGAARRGLMSRGRCSRTAVLFTMPKAAVLRTSS